MKTLFGIGLWVCVAGLFMNLTTTRAQQAQCASGRYSKMEAYVQYEDVAYSVIYFQCNKTGPYVNPKGVRLQTVDGVEVVTHPSNAKLLREIGVVK